MPEVMSFGSRSKELGMSSALSGDEEKVLNLMRQLPPAAAQELHDFVLFLAARHCGWSYGDQASHGYA
jgi:hypothetical protein